MYEEFTFGIHLHEQVSVVELEDYLLGLLQLVSSARCSVHGGDLICGRRVDWKVTIAGVEYLEDWRSVGGHRCA